MKKPTVPEVLPVVNALYRRHSAGCCWHVVLDDGNTGKDSVMWTVQNQHTFGCSEPECKQLCELLPLMSVTQVTKLSRLAGRESLTKGKADV